MNSLWVALKCVGSIPLVMVAVVALTNPTAQEPAPPARQLTVYAASSVTAVLEEFRDLLREDLPGLEVQLNFGGSQRLRTQLELGAPADLYLSANREQMDLARKSGLVRGEPLLVAFNQLVVIIPSRAPVGLATLQDLGRPGVKVVLAGPDVPVGRYSRKVLGNAAETAGFPADFQTRVLANVVSEETNVKQVLAKVLLGEAEAGIVYETDLTPGLEDQIRKIEIPHQLNQIASYYIAVTATSHRVDDAQHLVDMLVSSYGQAIFARHGFLAPREVL